MWNCYSNKVNISLIRHGKTFANEKKLYYGFSDISLSKSGIEELFNLKKTIKYPSAKLYITSGLIRANETMNILFNKKNYIIFEGFKEINFGDFELKSYNQLKNNKDYQKWIENIDENEIPNGETKKQFESRVINSFNTLLFYCFYKNIEDVVIICHSGVISLIMLNLFNEENKNFYDWIPSYGRGYTITFDKNKNYKHI